MSTVITITTPPEVKRILEDYKIHLTGENTDFPQKTGQYVSQDPPNWPTDRRRVPPYRPLNKELDPDERPRGANAGEWAFLNMMFTGVYLNASMAQLWGKTGGPYFPKLLRYAIGGEW